MTPLIVPAALIAFEFLRGQSASAANPSATSNGAGLATANAAMPGSNPALIPSPAMPGAPAFVYVPVYGGGGGGGTSSGGSGSGGGGGTSSGGSITPILLSPARPAMITRASVGPVNPVVSHLGISRSPRTQAF